MRRRMQLNFERIGNAYGVNGFVAELDLSRYRRWRTCGSNGVFLVYIQRENALVAMAWRSGWSGCNCFIVDIKE